MNLSFPLFNSIRWVVMLSQSLSIFADIPVHFKEVSTQIVASNGGHPCTSISFSLLHEGDVQNYNFILPEQELRIQVDIRKNLRSYCDQFCTTTIKVETPYHKNDLIQTPIISPQSG